MNDKGQQFYEYLKSSNIEVPASYAEFQSAMQDQNTASQFYDFVKSQDIDVPETSQEFQSVFSSSMEGEPVNFTNASDGAQEQSTSTFQQGSQPSEGGGTPFVDNTPEYLKSPETVKAEEQRGFSLPEMSEEERQNMPQSVVGAIESGQMYQDIYAKNLEEYTANADQEVPKLDLQISELQRGLGNERTDQATLRKIKELNSKRAGYLLSRKKDSEDVKDLNTIFDLQKDLSEEDKKAFYPQVDRYVKAVEPIIQKAIDEEVFDMENALDVQPDGTSTPNVAFAEYRANQVASKLGVDGEALNLISKMIQKKAKNYDTSKKTQAKMEQYGFIDPTVKAELDKFNETVLAPIKSDADEKVNSLYEESLRSAAEINAEYKARISDERYRIQMEITVAESRGEIPSEKAREILKRRQDQVTKNLQDEQSALLDRLNLNYNTTSSAIRDNADKEYLAQYNKFSKDNNLEDRGLNYLQAIQKRASEEVAAEENMLRVNYEDKNLTTFTTNFMNSMASSLSGTAQTLGFDGLVPVFDQMAYNNTPAMREYGDGDNWSKFSQTVGNLAGSQATQIPVQITVSALTGGFGTIGQMIAAGATGWALETASITGNMYNQTLMESGNIQEARRNAKQSYDAQVSNLWMYGLDGLPFVGKALNRIGAGSVLKTGATRFLAGGAIESGTETLQETVQGAQELAIVETGNYKNFDRYITPDFATKTFLEVAPTFFLGGGGQIVSTVRENAGGKRAAKEFTKEDVNDYIKASIGLSNAAPDVVKQVIYNTYLKEGFTFTAAMIEGLKANGTITSERATELGGMLKDQMNMFSTTKSLGLTPIEGLTYYAISDKYRQLKEQADAIENDDIAKGVIMDRANKFKQSASDFLADPKKGGSYVTVTTPNRPDAFLSAAEFKSFVEQDGVAEMIEGGKITYQSRNVDGVDNVVNDQLEKVAQSKGKKADQPQQQAEPKKEEEKELTPEENLAKAMQDIDSYIGGLVSETEEEVFGGKKVVDSTLDKMNNAEYVNDDEIEESKMAIDDEITRINSMDISDNAKKNIIDNLEQIKQELDNYEFRTKTNVIKTPAKPSTKGDGKVTEAAPEATKTKSETTAEVGGRRGFTITFLGGNKISLVFRNKPTHIKNKSVSSRTTTFTFPKDFLFMDEEGNFLKLILRDAEGNRIVIRDPEVGVPLALQNLRALTGPMKNETVSAVVEEQQATVTTEDVNYIKENKNAVQEQTTSEVPVQPEAKVGEKMAEGEPQAETKVAAEEAKKADIERRRQEDLDNKQKFVSSKKRQEREGGEYKEISIDDIDMEASGFDGNMEDVTKVIVLEERGLNSNGQKVAQVRIITKNGADTFEVFLNTDKINAKYDAELKALESTSTQTSNQSEIEAKEAPKTAKEKLKERSRKQTILKQIDNAKKAIARVAKGVEIIVATTPEHFEILGGDKGAYVNGKIYINLDKADFTTVAHEVFHGLLLHKGMSDAKARRLTENMLNTIRKTASQDLLARLDEFASMYVGEAAQFRSEESMAQLFGIIAESYAEMDGGAKSAVRQWLDGLIKALGLEGMFPKDMSPLTASDKEVLNFLNTVARKVATGEEVTDQDVAVLGEGSETATEQATRYQIDPRLSERGVEVDNKEKLPKKITPSNEKKVLKKIDELLNKYPNALTDRNQWKELMSRVFPYKDPNGVVTIPKFPEALSRMSKSVDEVLKELEKVSDKQRQLASSGIEGTKEIGKLYKEGKMDTTDTGLYFLWNIMSIGISPYPQEAGFLRAVNNGIDTFISKSEKGNFLTGELVEYDGKKIDSGLVEYFNWVDETLPKGVAGSSSKPNLRSFGSAFLSKASTKIESGEFVGLTKMQALHEIISDRTTPTNELRRKWLANLSGMSFNNKIFDFILLTTGRSDLFVVDRVRTEHFWDSDNLKKESKLKPTTSIYDGSELKYGNTTRAGYSKMLSDVPGLIFTELANRTMQPVVEEAYKKIGVTESPNVGRFHWETWVAASSQEVSHGSIGAIVQRKKEGDITDAGIRQGKYGAWDFNFTYRKKAGQDFVYEFTDEDGNVYIFEDLSNVYEEISSQNTKKGYKDNSERFILKDEKGNITKRKTQKIDQAWYDQEGVNKQRYFDFLKSEAKEFISAPDVVEDQGVVIDRRQTPRKQRDAKWEQEAKDNLPDSNIKSKFLFEDKIKSGKWAMLTGENPNAKPATEEENKKFNEDAVKWLKKLDKNPIPIFGKYGGAENSFFVENLRSDDAAAFAREFKQESVATNEGLILPNGDRYPRLKGEEEFNSEEDDYYSVINIKGEKIPFKVGYDVENLETALPEKIKEKLTDDGKGNYVFYHYSSEKRDVLKPFAGDAARNFTSKEEASALSSVGGVVMFYTDPNTKEAGVGNVKHTITIPKDKVYYFQTDRAGLYLKAKELFNEARPNQAFSPNHQAAWISKIMDEAGYEILVSDWKDEKLRAQTTKEVIVDESARNKAREKKAKQTPRKQKPSIQEMIDFAKEEGISKKDLREFLKEEGYSDAAIKEALPRPQVRPPSARRVLGQPKPKKVTVQEMAALKDQIRLEARAARGAVSFINKIRRDIQSAIEGLQKIGKLSTKQVNSITNKLNKVNLLNPIMRERFIDYMEKVYNNAEYAAKLSQARATRAKVKKKIKSEGTDAVLGSAAKVFAKVDPSMVDDIDAYNELADKVLSGLSSSRVGGSLRSAFDIDGVLEYANKKIEEQDKEILNKLKETFEEITGTDPKDMTYAEMMSLLEVAEDDNALDDKNKQVRAVADAYFDLYSKSVSSMISDKVDPFTGEDIEVDPYQAELMKRLMSLDRNNFTTKELVQAVDILNNFVVNGKVGGVEKIVMGKEGLQSAQGLKGLTQKAFRFFTKKVGRIEMSGITSLNLLFERKFGGFSAGQKVMKAMGLQDLKKAASTVMKTVDVAIVNYYDKFGKTKPNGEEFNSAYNNAERGLYASLKRTVNGTAEEQAAEFKRMKNLWKESTEYHKNGTEKEKVIGEKMQKAYAKIAASSNSIAEVESKMDATNKQATEYWMDKFKGIKPSLDQVSLSMYNTVLEDDLFYTPITTKRKVGEDGIVDDNVGSFSALTGNSVVAPGKAGQLKQINRPATLSARYLSPDFDTNMANAYNAALMDISTAPYISKIKGFMNSKEGKALFGSQEDYKVVVKRVQDYINAKRGQKRFSTNKDFDRVIDLISKLGAARALGSISQPVKQTIPVAINAMIASNPTNFLTASGLISGNKDAMKFLEGSGYAIAVRGASARASIDSMDQQVSKLLSKTNGDVGKVMELISGEWLLNNVLVKPDVFVAKVSWMSFYLQNLNKQGVKTGNIDWATHKINTEAAEYAQGMVDRSQNVSDSDLQGSYFTDPSTSMKFVRGMFPFMTFILNQKERMYSDIITISSLTSSKEDKETALRSLMGTLAEIGSFSYISYYISAGTFTVAAAMIGYDEPEEEKKKRLANLWKGKVTNFTSDILSPFPPVSDYAIMATINAAANATYGEDVVYEPRDKSLPEQLGVFGITASKALDLKKLLDMAYDGKFMKESFGKETEKTLTQGQQDSAKLASALLMMHLLGAPSDLGNVSNYIRKTIEKNSSTVSSKTKSSKESTKKKIRIPTFNRRRLSK